MFSVDQISIWWGWFSFRGWFYPSVGEERVAFLNQDGFDDGLVHDAQNGLPRIIDTARNKQYWHSIQKNHSLHYNHDFTRICTIDSLSVSHNDHHPLLWFFIPDLIKTVLNLQTCLSFHFKLTFTSESVLFHFCGLHLLVSHSPPDSSILLQTLHIKFMKPLKEQRQMCSRLDTFRDKCKESSMTHSEDSEK